MTVENIPHNQIRSMNVLIIFELSVLVILFSSNIIMQKLNETCTNH